MANKPTKEQYEGFKKAVANPMTPAPLKASLQGIIDKYSSEYEGGATGMSAEEKPKATRGRKPVTAKKYKTLPKPKVRAMITSTKQAVEEMKAKLKKFGYDPEEVDNLSGNEAYSILQEVEGKMTKRKPSTRKPATAKTKQTATDIEKAKAEIKAKTGKTEAECESIIEQYRALRTKAQEGKRKAEQASAVNKERVGKLERKGDIIEGTNEKTADAVIESTAKDVAEKIEKQVEAIEKKATTEAKAEVAKDKTITTPKAKKDAVEAIVDEKVKANTKTIVKRVVIDTSALLTSIATSLGKFDKDSQKEFLIKLRSDIDKLLAKYAFGGMTDGATQVMNVQQSNLSASSVNPTLFAGGGGVENADTKKIIESISEIRYDSLPPVNERNMSQRAYEKILLDATKEAIKDLYRNEYYDLHDIQKATRESGGVYNKAFVELYGEKLTYANGGGVESSRNEDIRECKKLVKAFCKEYGERFKLNEKEIMSKVSYNGYLGHGASVFVGLQVNSNIDNLKVGEIKPTTAFVRLSSDINPNGVSKEIGIARSYVIEFRVEGSVRKRGGRTEEKPFFYAYQYGTTIDEVMNKFEDKVLYDLFPLEFKNGLKLAMSVVYANGGGVGEKSYNNPANNTHVLIIDGQNWYLEKIDSTHFYMSNSPNFRGMANHIGQHKGESYYDEVRQWLKETFAGGGGVNDISYDEVLDVLKDKLEDAVQNVPNEFENSYNATGEEVESKSRDGFIPYTDGGYEVRWFEYLSGFYGSGYSLPTKALDKEKDRQIDYNFELAKENFINEYPEIVEELGEENIDYNSLQEAGYESEAEELSEMEMNFDGDDTIMCEIGAYYYTPSNDRGIDGEHTLRLFGLVNLEAPYHRSGNLEDRYDIDITFNSISELEEKVEEGLNEITEWFNGSKYNEPSEELRIRRMATGGKLWIDTKTKGGLKGVSPSRKNSFRNEAVKRGITSGQLASRVLANPTRYKGINPKSAQLVRNMGVRKQGGSIGDIIRSRRGQ